MAFCTDTACRVRASAALYSWPSCGFCWKVSCRSTRQRRETLRCVFSSPRLPCQEAQKGSAYARNNARSDFKTRSLLVHNRKQLHYNQDLILSRTGSLGQAETAFLQRSTDTQTSAAGQYHWFTEV